MKKAFKIATVIGSTFLIGISTLVAGASFSPFVQDNTPNFSVVYGAGGTDGPTATALGNYFNDMVEVVPDVVIDTGTQSKDSGIGNVTISQGSENDGLLLGNNIPAETFDDGDIEYFIDSKVEWDDGDDEKDYDVHEEVNILDDKLGFITLLDDEDLSENYALTNNKGLVYKYVFDEAPDFSKLGTEDADNLKIKFLGKSLEIKNADDNSITVVTSDEMVVSEGQTIKVGGVDLNIKTIFESHVEVNGELIKEGYSEKVDGLIVEVDTIAYNSNDKPSMALIRVGTDISEEYSTNDAYIGEDEDDPRWVWDIDLTAVKPYIGIKYNEKESDSDDDILYSGEAYTFPEGYVALKFDGTTKVDNIDYTLSIDEEELYDANENELFDGDDKSVVILDGKEDSIETAFGQNEETSKIYLYYNHGADRIESYYYDTDENKAMKNGQFNSGVVKIATLNNDDKEVDVYATRTGDTTKYLEVYFDDDGSRQIVSRFRLSGDSDQIISLGGTAEESEATEVQLLNKGTLKGIGNKDYDVINENGYGVNNPESNGENDEITFSIPSDDVEATVSIGRPLEIDTSDNTSDDTNNTVVDTTPENTYDYKTIQTSQISYVKDRNLIVVGGSCINEVSASLLGGKACGEEFTAKTGVVAGKALIKSFKSPYNDGKIAVVVAGYNKADTDRAVEELKSGTYNLTVGKEYIV